MWGNEIRGPKGHSRSGKLYSGRLDAFIRHQMQLPTCQKLACSKLEGDAGKNKKRGELQISFIYQTLFCCQLPLVSGTHFAFPQSLTEIHLSELLCLSALQEPPQKPLPSTAVEKYL